MDEWTIDIPMSLCQDAAPWWRHVPAAWLAMAAGQPRPEAAGFSARLKKEEQAGPGSLVAPVDHPPARPRRRTYGFLFSVPGRKATLAGTEHDSPSSTARPRPQRPNVS